MCDKNEIILRRNWGDFTLGLRRTHRTVESACVNLKLSRGGGLTW